MFAGPAQLTIRTLIATTMVVGVTGLAACGDDADTAGDSATAPAQTTPAQSTPEAEAAATPAAAQPLEKVTDTAATVASASAAALSSSELEQLLDDVAKGLKDGGFTSAKDSTSGGAKANFSVDRSWGLQVFASEREAAQWALEMQSEMDDDANYVLFRVGTRVYGAFQEDTLSDADRAKLDAIADSVESTIEG